MCARACVRAHVLAAHQPSRTLSAACGVLTHNAIVSSRRATRPSRANTALDTHWFVIQVNIFHVPRPFLFSSEHRTRPTFRLETSAFSCNCVVAVALGLSHAATLCQLSQQSLNAACAAAVYESEEKEALEKGRCSEITKLHSTECQVSVIGSWISLRRSSNAKTVRFVRRSWCLILAC